MSYPHLKSPFLWTKCISFLFINTNILLIVENFAQFILIILTFHSFINFSQLHLLIPPLWICSVCLSVYLSIYLPKYLSTPFLSLSLFLSLKSEYLRAFGLVLWLFLSWHPISLDGSLALGIGVVLVGSWHPAVSLWLGPVVVFCNGVHLLQHVPWLRDENYSYLWVYDAVRDYIDLESTNSTFSSRLCGLTDSWLHLHYQAQIPSY